MPGRDRAQGTDALAPTRNTVLVVDDQDTFHGAIEPHLRGFRILSAYNGRQAVKQLASHHVDVVLLDLNLPDTTGLELLGTLRKDRDDIEVIVMTAHSELRNAVQAVKLGAFDFLAKSFENYQQIGAHVRRALEHQGRKRSAVAAQTGREWLDEAFRLMEHSCAPAMTEVVSLLRQAAPTPLTVLLEGESGVGKEIAARYVHARSPRAEHPLVAINLAAIPASLRDSHLFGHVKGAFTGAEKTMLGKFELATGGTVFIDEIGELDPTAQVKLLRVLQEREVERLGATEPAPVDVRVIAATNKNLAVEVREGRFREDLFYRLNVVRVTIPPLRSRLEDLPALAATLVSKHAGRMNREAPTLSSGTVDVLSEYGWPGNVRELENLIMRLVAFNPGRVIEADDVPAEYFIPALNSLARELAKSGADRNEDRLYFLARDQFERYLVRLIVERCKGDRAAAARVLGVSASTIKQKLTARR